MSALRRHLRRTPRAQALVELAIVLPVLLLLLGGAIDVGRLFFTRVAVESAAKEGALFGSQDPACKSAGAGCGDPSNVEWHVRSEAPGIDLSWDAQCRRAGAPVSPPAKCAAGDEYRVTVDYTFEMVTPILSGIFGSGINLSTTATAVVFSGEVAAGTPMPFQSSTPAPEVDPPGQCLVPNLVGLKANKTDAPWQARNFTGSLTKSGSGNFVVVGQGLQAGTFWPCETAMTVSNQSITPSPAPTASPSPSPSSTPSATAAPTATPSPTPIPSPQCRLVPTLEGFTVAAARSKWTAAGFTGTFSPNGQNTKLVNKQTTTPASNPGDCIPPNSSVSVTHS